MLRRVAAVLIGVAVLILGILGQPTATRRAMLALYTAGAGVAVAVEWCRVRESDTLLTWKRVTGVSILGAVAVGVVVGLFGPSMLNTTAEGLGTGFFVGLLFSGVHRVLRGP